MNDTAEPAEHSPPDKPRLEDAMPDDVAAVVRSIWRKALTAVIVVAFGLFGIFYGWPYLSQYFDFVNEFRLTQTKAEKLQADHTKLRERMNALTLRVDQLENVQDNRLERFERVEEFVRTWPAVGESVQDVRQNAQIKDHDREIMLLRRKVETSGP